MNAPFGNLAALAGRILLSILFVQSGLGKITGFAASAAAIAAKGLPFPELLVVGSIVVELAGAAMLVFGWKARWAALAIFLWLIPVTFFFHNPLVVPADQVRMQTIHLLKNLAIMGGMLMVYALGPGRWSLDRK